MSEVDVAGRGRDEPRDRPLTDRSRTDRPRCVWFAFLASPVAWLVHLAVAAGLVPVSCELETEILLHLTTVVTALAAAAGVYVSWQLKAEHGGRGGTPAFMGTAGFWMGLLFLALILVEQIPVFTVDPCR